MEKIQIDDIKLLSTLTKDILDAREQIKELPEVKKLREKALEKKVLKEKIVKYSTYDVEQIGKVLSELMTSFEGIPYCLSRDGWTSDYDIEPRSFETNNVLIYKRFKFNKLKQKTFLFDYYKEVEQKDKCLFLPSGFNSNKIYDKKDYIQVFLDFLYQKRTQRSLEKIKDEELDEILKNFLEISTDLQLQRKREIKEKIEELIQERKRRELKRACVIDRNLIFNALMYIINHYEENMEAVLEENVEWRVAGNMQLEGTSYQTLLVNYNNKKCCSFKAVVDTITCYMDSRSPDPSMNKKGNVSFFDLKWDLSQAIKNSTYLPAFMSNVEQIYFEKKRNKTR